jgi:hypothetical protein
MLAALLPEFRRPSRRDTPKITTLVCQRSASCADYPTTGPSTTLSILKRPWPPTSSLRAPPESDPTHVDLDAAIAHGITVAEMTNSNSNSVAEHAVMMILALVRNYLLSHQTVRDRGWNIADFMMRSRDCKPWALMFDRGSVYRAGGGPVWHARDVEAKALRELDDPIFRSWVVRLGVDPAPSDWLEEREWRIVLGPTSEPPSMVPLERLKLVGILIDDVQWTGAHSGQTGLPVPPPRAIGVSRYRWDRSNHRLVFVQPSALSQPT